MGSGRGPPPGQKPALETSCEYASSVIESGTPGVLGCAGARRPEKRVTARSKLPQKKWTGLHLPTNCERNRLKTGSQRRRMSQKRCAYSLSYEACCSSSSNRMGSATSTGFELILGSMPRD